MNTYTNDWQDSDIAELVALAGRLGAKPLDLAGCWMNESGLSTKAWNRNGDASGLFQLMPATARGLGFFGDMATFRMLSVAQQLHWAEKYYGPHRGQLVTPGACYLCTFLPAYMPYAGRPLFVLCSPTLHPEWYQANLGFDHTHKGYINVQDLTDAMNRATVGPRWEEFAARVRAAMEPLPDTLPEVNEMNRDAVTVPDVTAETFPSSPTIVWDPTTSHDPDEDA